MENTSVHDSIGATVLRNSGEWARSKISGIYYVKCFDPEGNLKWEDTADNLITDVGANFLLNQGFGATQNSTYFLGLISSVGWTAVAAGQTMASHTTGGWQEAGNGSNYPVWTSPATNARATITWNAAGSRAKAIASAASFTIGATGGTVKGCFIVTGSGAVATNNDTNGTLYSCGTFTGGDKIVGVSDTLQVSYTTSLS